MPLANDLGITSVLDVLQHRFALDGEERGDEYWVLCPNPNHADTKPSCSINLNTGLWNCFACGSGGDILALGAMVLGVPRVLVERDLKPNTLDALNSRLRRNVEEYMRKDKATTTPKVAPPHRYAKEPMVYLLQRGYKPETLERWGVRYVQQEKFEGKSGIYIMRDYIAIPIRETWGDLVAWCYRATHDNGPRYLYTRGAPLADLWFGENLLGDAKQVVITEGALDTMWIDQAGLPALGALGVSMAKGKYGFLTQFHKVTLFFDRDAAGVKGVMEVGEKLKNKVPLYVARYGSRWKGSDPQDLSAGQVRRAVRRAIPYMVWRQGLGG